MRSKLEFSPLDQGRNQTHDNGRPGHVDHARTSEPQQAGANAEQQSTVWAGLKVQSSPESRIKAAVSSGVLGLKQRLGWSPSAG
jgi:hypothetical protein